MEVAAANRERSDWRRKLLRALGLTSIVLGLLVLVWAFVVWQWNDPFTGLYTRYEQSKLAKAYAQREKSLESALPVIPARTPLSVERAKIAREAARYRARSSEGEAIGRIIVPRLGLNMILVNGTAESSLERGPGRDLQTYMPGQGQLVYIAGHRTTFLAPFAHIDQLRVDDSITLSMPYGTFVYRVFAHVIVPADDVARLRSTGHDMVALQACHPRFFASHRYIVYGRLVEETPRHGRPYRIAA
jgi:sortase A